MPDTDLPVQVGGSGFFAGEAFCRWSVERGGLKKKHFAACPETSTSDTAWRATPQLGGLVIRQGLRGLEKGLHTARALTQVVRPNGWLAFFEARHPIAAMVFNGSQRESDLSFFFLGGGRSFIETSPNDNPLQVAPMMLGNRRLGKYGQLG